MERSIPCAVNRVLGIYGQAVGRALRNGQQGHGQYEQQGRGQGWQFGNSNTDSEFGGFGSGTSGSGSNTTPGSTSGSSWNFEMSTPGW